MRHLITAALACAVLAFGLPAQASLYPSSATDLVARTTANASTTRAARAGFDVADYHGGAMDGLALSLAIADATTAAATGTQPARVLVTGLVTTTGYTHVIPDGVTLEGVGPGARIKDTTEVNRIIVQVPGSGHEAIRNLTIQGPITGQTTGQSICLQQAQAASGVGGTLALEHVVTIGCSIGTQFLAAHNMALTDLYNVSPKDIGLDWANVVTPDGGDSFLAGHIVSGGGTNSICFRWRSSGGLKVSNPKWLSCAVGAGIYPDDGVVTTQLSFVGYSIENFASVGVDAAAGGTSALNQAAVPTAGTAGTGTVDFVSFGAGFVKGDTKPNVSSVLFQFGPNIKDWEISGAHLVGDGATTTGVRALAGTSGGLVASSYVANIPTVFVDTNGGQQFAIGRNRYTNSGSTALFSTSGGSLVSSSPMVMRDFDRTLNWEISPNSQTFQNLLTAGIVNYYGMELDIRIDGIVQGSGGGVFSYRARKLITRNSTGVPTVTDVFTPVDAGAQIDVQVDVVTDNTKATVGVRPHTGVGTSVNGRAEIDPRGVMNLIQVVQQLK